MAKAKTVKTRPVCDECGSTDVAVDAMADWNPETGKFDEVRCTYDTYFCEKCDGECSIMQMPFNQDQEDVERYDLSGLANTITPSGRTYKVTREGYGYRVRRNDGKNFGAFTTKADAQDHADEMTAGKDVAIQRDIRWSLVSDVLMAKFRERQGNEKGKK